MHKTLQILVHGSLYQDFNFCAKSDISPYDGRHNSSIVLREKVHELVLGDGGVDGCMHARECVCVRTCVCMTVFLRVHTHACACVSMQMHTYHIVC